MNFISGKDCRQQRRGGAGRHESARRRRVGPERGVFVLVGGVGGRGGGDRRAYLRDRTDSKTDAMLRAATAVVSGEAPFLW